jgi:branched-chain amino acid transport system ATP-binding protein
MSSCTTCTSAGTIAPMSELLLEVDSLNAYYSSAHVLHDVTFSVGRESVAIIGRNGMGKTTLCAAIMGFTPPRASGSVRFEGAELMGKPPHKIARAGLGYVPQGRRLFPSLTVDEHLKIAARNGGGNWSSERVYELFPRLAERKRNGGAELSGGEQQMLAIGRALLGDPKLLIMDEPSEGLAPTIVDVIVETFRKLKEEGLAILLIEQKLDVATSLASRQLVMVGGEIALETTAAELERDIGMQRRYLGVEPVAREDSTTA